MHDTHQAGRHICRPSADRKAAPLHVLYLKFCAAWQIGGLSTHFTSGSLLLGVYCPKLHTQQYSDSLSQYLGQIHGPRDRRPNLRCFKIVEGHHALLYHLARCESSVPIWSEFITVRRSQPSMPSWSSFGHAPDPARHFNIEVSFYLLRRSAVQNGTSGVMERSKDNA